MLGSIKVKQDAHCKVLKFCTGSVNHEKKEIPPVLRTFLKQPTVGKRGLTEPRNIGIENEDCIIANTMLYRIKDTDR